ncbi:glycine betaine ABC transporter substrate-binding protein [Mesorhizobium sp. LHD-90]|uniref:ABC transporter substrate-binding protein n=1 Tax=Mesorhizobium sp. LHD-90 TaxID=3071414 RepID=UPI0027E11A81|nr:glycine betaine ABC transporter substrate-binding protein [Mesorhizobium sp. LHD-90]MDQ6436602.1 glycine betaine ABC transporter substrate-binding protein [Mesorhizobium sp. LHD-90]
MRRVIQSAVIALAAIVNVSGPANAADLTIAMPNWWSGKATANIIKVGLKKEFGIDAEAVEMGTLTAFAGLDSGQVDIHPEVWLPNLDNLVKRYVTDAGTVAMSPIGVPAWQGICATRTTADKDGIRDISDLSDEKKTAVLDTDGDGRGELWIGAPTWSSTEIERIRANSYGYAKTLTLLEVQEDVGMAAVDAAEATQRPMVFACYAPHAVFKLHDIVRLTEPAYNPAKWKVVLPAEDPDWLSKSNAAVGWDAAHYHIAYAASLRQKHPDVVRFLERIDFKPEEAIDMSYALQVERQDPLAFAEQWVAKNQARVDGWAKP